MQTDSGGPLTMRAMRVRVPRAAEEGPLELCEEPLPEPGAGEVRVRVEVCGVCRTDLHVAEGDLPPQRPSVIPGHEVVGRVDAVGSGTDLRAGERVGVAWLHESCGACRFCARGAENLCLAPRFTGWHADGGYAEFCVAPAAFVYRLPEAADAETLAPLLCAGIIGYRAYALSGVAPGERLGIFGFGGSAHLVIQIARHRGNPVYVWSRGERHQALARELGAEWVGESGARAPEPLRGAILFAPAGELVPVALEALDRGGTLAVAGIHLSDVPPLDYQRHLFQERILRSVTANTRSDGRELLRLAAEIPLRAHTVPYPLERANEALVDLKQDRVRGAAVLRISRKLAQDRRRVEVDALADEARRPRTGRTPSSGSGTPGPWARCRAAAPRWVPSSQNSTITRVVGVAQRDQLVALIGKRRARLAGSTRAPRPRRRAPAPVAMIS